MPIVTETGFAEDAWRRAPADAAAERPAQAGEILAFKRLAEERLEGPRIGVDLPNDQDPEALAPFFPRLGLIAVAFPSFADGRGFSLAKRLRDLGYAGRLRASGHVIADQFAAARACGFDEVEIDDALAARQPEEMWRAEAERPLWYQRPLRRAG